jgi:hypothetical protein
MVLNSGFNKSQFLLGAVRLISNKPIDKEKIIVLQSFGIKTYLYIDCLDKLTIDYKYPLFCVFDKYIINRKHSQEYFEKFLSDFVHTVIPVFSNDYELVVFDLNISDEGMDAFVRGAYSKVPEKDKKLLTGFEAKRVKTKDNKTVKTTLYHLFYPDVETKAKLEEYWDIKFDPLHFPEYFSCINPGDETLCLSEIDSPSIPIFQ